MVDYNKIRLVNGVQNAVAQALADVAVVGLDIKIKAYKNGTITADEFLDYLEKTNQYSNSKE